MNAQILQLKRLFGAPDAALLSGLAAPLLRVSRGRWRRAAARRPSASIRKRGSLRAI